MLQTSENQSNWLPFPLWIDHISRQDPSDDGVVAKMEYFHLAITGTGSLGTGRFSTGMEIFLYSSIATDKALFSSKTADIFLISPQHMFWWRNKKKYYVDSLSYL